MDSTYPLKIDFLLLLSYQTSSVSQIYYDYVVRTITITKVAMPLVIAFKDVSSNLETPI